MTEKKPNRRGADLRVPRAPSAKLLETRAAAAALDAIIAARPLRPPPMPQWHDTRSAAARELANEIRVGAYEP